MMKSAQVREILGAVTLMAAVAVASPTQAQQSGRAQQPQTGRAQQPGQWDRNGGPQRMDPQQRLERRVAMLTERLTLTASQAARVRPILEREQEQMAQLFGSVGFGRAEAQGQSGGRGNRSWGRAQPDQGGQGAQRRTRPDSAQLRQFRTRAEQIQTATRQELARVLTAPQLQKYDALRPEGTRNAWGQRRGGGWERGGRGARTSGARGAGN